MIRINRLKKNYENKKIFSDFNMNIEPCNITCILGPSGVGKTTLFNVISGLTDYEDGEIIGIDKKNISYLFQEPRLMPWLTVYGNIDIILKNIFPDKKRKDVINYYLDMVGLKDYTDKKPEELSGGMKQRLAIARTFAYPSTLLLMDEPFQGLDIKLKNNIIESFLKLWSEDNRTVLFITHDIDEALRVSDQIYIIQDNPVKISQVEHIIDDKLDRDIYNDDYSKIRKRITKVLTS
ncbi:MAG: ABC transporter ATP-binding protein [Bacillota bacterium]|nr:ABC transporter ATP-binding protein [Bacillota bacterium]